MFLSFSIGLDNTYGTSLQEQKNLGYQKLRFKVNTSIRLGQTVVLGDTDDQEMV